MKISVVTHNPGKVREYQKALGGYGIEMAHVNREYDEVQTSRLEEVVEKGMSQLHAEGLRDFMIDDSGLFIDGLGGFPGVYSAYVQKTLGNAGVLKQMEGVEDRRASFRCCIGLWVGDVRIVAAGACPGVILDEARGSEGFGYDPIFSPDGSRSFAEMPLDEKNAVSHRGRALSKLVEEMKAAGLV